MIEDIQNLPDGFISGVIIGVLASVFAFILTMIWDTYKSFIDKKRKDKTISTALRHEIESNINILRNNKGLIKHELEVIKNKETIVNPLTPLHNQMWSVITLNMPNILIRNPQLFESLREATHEIMATSEAITSRENYRVNNAVNTARYHQLEIYDDIILQHTINALETLETLVQEF